MQCCSTQAADGAAIDLAEGRADQPTHGPTISVGFDDSDVSSSSKGTYSIRVSVPSQPYHEEKFKIVWDLNAAIANMQELLRTNR